MRFFVLQKVSLTKTNKDMTYLGLDDSAFG